MAFNHSLFAEKLSKYRKQFGTSIEELSAATGIDLSRIVSFENAERAPTGDEVLIIADFFKCDYNFFISNEKLAPFEQTETLFRAHGDELSNTDRWSIQEIMFLADCEHFLQNETGEYNPNVFSFTKTGKFLKKHGKDCAKALRKHFNYENKIVPLDIYQDFRNIGIHVFRRKLENSRISGMYIKHPVAGKCIIINYLEDVFRQRFTAAHEAAHAILDDDEDIYVSYSNWGKSNLIEIRANTFASNYLMPEKTLRLIPDPKN